MVPSGNITLWGAGVLSYCRCITVFVSPGCIHAVLFIIFSFLIHMAFICRCHDPFQTDDSQFLFNPNRKEKIMNKPFKLLAIWLVVIAAVSLTSGAKAETDTDKTLSPYFFIEGGDPGIDRFPLKKTEVTANISGVIADVTILQKYTNNGTRPISAKYVFPASTRAAVHGMTMKIGEQVIKARVQERKAAQKVFKEALKQGKSASLLNQERPNVFSMNVANVMPGDEIDIELHYTELLMPTDGTYQFMFPTVVGPRYSGQPESEAAENDLWVKNPYLKENSEPRSTFSLSVNLTSGLPLQQVVSPSHDIDVQWENKTTAALQLKGEGLFAGNRDFILHYRLVGREIQSGLMLYSGEEENFFLLMAQPPEKVRPEDIPPREFIFVVDVSGSMHGFPLNTAKKLLKNLIGDLRVSDLFNVVLFAGGSNIMSPVSVPADGQNIARAIRFIESQRGGGGTELYAALKRALSLHRDEGYARTVLLVSDGYISAEKEVFHLIRDNLNRTNVFSFGIGSSVNRYLIEGLARAGMGESFVVTKPEESGATAERFREYVASPVLTDIKIRFDGFETYDVEPETIPDMLARRPVITFGKWRGAPEGTIRITGTGGSGTHTQTLTVADTKPLKQNSALRYLWARTRIAELSDFNFRKDTAESRAEVTSLGLTYNLMTAHTSFVAVHDVVRNPEGNSRQVKQPLPLPKGVSNLAVGGSYAKVPEPELFLLLAIMGVFIWMGARRRNRKP